MIADDFYKGEGEAAKGGNGAPGPEHGFKGGNVTVGEEPVFLANGTIYQVDLATGEATPMGMRDPDVFDIMGSTEPHYSDGPGIWIYDEADIDARNAVRKITHTRQYDPEHGTFIALTAGEIEAFEQRVKRIL